MDLFTFVFALFPMNFIWYFKFSFGKWISSNNLSFLLQTSTSGRTHRKIEDYVGYASFCSRIFLVLIASELFIQTILLSGWEFWRRRFGFQWNRGFFVTFDKISSTAHCYVFRSSFFYIGASIMPIIIY